MNQSEKVAGRLSRSERLLLLLSRKPGTVEHSREGEGTALAGAPSQLCRAFPDFPGLIAGKDVLDFGCGEGWQAVAMAQRGARFVLGLDSNANTLAKACRLAPEGAMGDRVKP
jgi:2-polyprenyl-3-methyl-5-hydroxy-6-metoxy-1,4-benzoquinol methylase